MEHIEDVAINLSKSYKRKYQISKIRFWWQYKLFHRYYKKKHNKAVEQFNDN